MSLLGTLCDQDLVHVAVSSAEEVGVCILKEERGRRVNTTLKVGRMSYKEKKKKKEKKRA
jgi:hypothetical protein